MTLTPFDKKLIKKYPEAYIQYGNKGLSQDQVLSKLASIDYVRHWEYKCDICHRRFPSERKAHQHVLTRHKPTSWSQSASWFVVAVKKRLKA